MRLEVFTLISRVSAAQLNDMIRSLNPALTTKYKAGSFLGVEDHRITARAYFGEDVASPTRGPTYSFEHFC